MQLKEKVAGEVGAFIYRLERGRFDSEADKDAVIRIIEDLKTSVEALRNTVGTGEEDIESLANNILSLLKDLKKSSEQDMLHRIQEVADELDFNINMWKDVLDGVTTVPSEEEAKAAKLSYTRRKLNARLVELAEIKDNFVASARRIEKEIVGFEKDLAELDAAMLNEDNERRINEIFKKISALKSKLDSLIVRKSNYTTCFNLLDMIYVNAAEIVEASDYVGEEIGKAKAFLNIAKLKKVLSEPDKALTVLKRMQKDIQEVYDRTKAIDIKLGEMPTTSTVVNDAALAYKEELMRKKREKERNDQNAAEITTAETKITETATEEV
jgi:hypothetical protein